VWSGGVLCRVIRCRYRSVIVCEILQTRRLRRRCRSAHVCRRGGWVLGGCGEGALGLGRGSRQGEGFGGDDLVCGFAEVNDFGFSAGSSDDGLGDLADDGGREPEVFFIGAGLELLVAAAASSPNRSETWVRARV